MLHHLNIFLRHRAGLVAHNDDLRRERAMLGFDFEQDIVVPVNPRRHLQRGADIDELHLHFAPGFNSSPAKAGSLCLMPRGHIKEGD